MLGGRPERSVTAQLGRGRRGAMGTPDFWLEQLMD